jgi:F-type H+-transporting ATPase subunit delta
MSVFASRYARAFADVAASAHLDTAAVDRQLADFLATWDGSRELREVFENPAIPAPQKVAILDKMNSKLGLQRELRNLIAVLINNDRIAAIREVADAWRAEMQERMGIRQAEIVTARELNEQERRSLIEGAAKLAGTQVQATFKLDKEILGGTVVRIGSTVYDGSVRGRLERLREALTSGQ